MRRWTRPTESKSSTLCGTDLVCENRLVVGLSAIEDGQLKKALQCMYIPRDAIILGDTVGRGQYLLPVVSIVKWRSEVFSALFWT